MSELAVAPLLAATILVASMISVDVGFSVALIELAAGALHGTTANASRLVRLSPFFFLKGGMNVSARRAGANTTSLLLGGLGCSWTRR